MRFTATIMLIILFTWGGTSCRKEKTFQVQIVNPVTGEGHANSSVYITETSNSSDCLYCSPEAEEFYAGTTDENGVLTIREDFHKNYKYTLYIGTDVQSCHTEGFHEGRNTSGPKIVLDNDNLAGSTVLFEVVPCASLKLDIDNLNCQGSGDVMRFRGLNLDVKGEYNGWSTERTGCYIYESPNYFDVPMGRQIYEWEVTRQDGSKEYYADTMYLDEGTQNVFPIQY